MYKTIDMNPVARKHHYVSQAYLAEFTDTQTKKGQLCVYSKADSRIFKSIPNGVAAERDFNRVDIKDQRIDVLESALARAEGDLLPAIKRVISSSQFPNGKDLIRIINIMAMFYIHNPKQRAIIDASRAQLSKLAAYHIADDEKNPTQRAKFKEYIESDKFKPSFTPESSTRIELSALDGAIEALLGRYWTLNVLSDKCPDFITADYPVALVRDSSDALFAGLGSKGFDVHFPLGPRHALYGSHTYRCDLITLDDINVVLGLNTEVYNCAYRQLYSRENPNWFAD